MSNLNNTKTMPKDNTFNNLIMMTNKKVNIMMMVNNYNKNPPTPKTMAKTTMIRDMVTKEKKEITNNPNISETS